MTNKHRISKVTTRAGDKGTTKLATGKTVGKHEQIMRVIGSVDELNSHLGMLEAKLASPSQQQIHQLQQALFDMGAVFAMEGGYEAPTCDQLEALTEQINKQLPPLTEFVLPRGGEAACAAHVCRTVCRRAELELWTLVHDEDPAPESYVAAARYLNRLSDYFFVLARKLGLASEQQWHGPNHA